MMQKLFAFLSLGLITSRVSSQGTQLGDHLTTRTNAQEYADISLDLRDIRVYVEKGQKDQVLGLFQNGLHAEHSVGNKWPLAQLNKDMAGDRSRTPMYLFHLYGLNNLSPNGKEDRSTYINDYIRSTIDENLAMVPEAVLSLSMWMYANHLLFNGASICHERTKADNPDVFDLGGGGMDEFIAFWIGSDQPVASEGGHGLYDWAQRAGKLFGKAVPEAEVNRNLKVLYQEGAQALSANKACTTNNKETDKQIWTVAAQMKRQMMIPLFQWLIYYLIQGDQQNSRLYGQALVPSLSQIRPSLFRSLMNSVGGGLSINFAQTEEIISDLREAASYFGISCEDIGSLAGDFKSACGSRDTIYPLAGYRPAHDVSSVSFQVHQCEHSQPNEVLTPYLQLSRVDLDIRQIRLLRDLEAYEYAELWYMFGQNMDGPRNSDTDPFKLISLQEMALSTEREKAGDLYKDFVSFFDNTNFGSVAMKDALNDDTKWQDRVQNSVTATGIAVHQIVLVHVAARLRESVAECKKIDPESFEGFLSNPVDEAAALLIGSLEGRALGGSPDLEDGILLYHVANRHASNFGTVNERNYAKVNAELVDMLYASKGAFEAFDCGNLERTIQRIIRLFPVGMMQAALWEATRIVDKATDENIRKEALANAESLALSLVPMIATSDGESAQVIYENLVWKEGDTPVRDGVHILGDALGASILGVFDLPCDYLGSLNDIKPCRHTKATSSGNAVFRGSAHVLFSAVVMALLAL